MGNAVVFGRAFKECGFGGRFSKFQIAQVGDWFELINVDKLEDSKFCYRVYDRFNHKAYRKVEGQEARNLHDDPQWISYFQNAGMLISKIISKSNNRGETRYYIDDRNQSVIIINRMFVIEVTPVMREALDVPSFAAFNFLESNAYRVPNPDDEVTVFTKFGKVVLYMCGLVYNTLMSVDEFNTNYGIEA